MNIKYSASAKIFVLLMILSACGGGSRKVSTTTGWSYNDPEMGGFGVKDGKKKTYLCYCKQQGKLWKDQIRTASYLSKP